MKYCDLLKLKASHFHKFCPKNGRLIAYLVIVSFRDNLNVFLSQVCYFIEISALHHSSLLCVFVEGLVNLETSGANFD